MINLRENKKINAVTGENFNRYLVDLKFKQIKYLSREDEIRLFKQLNTVDDRQARAAIIRATQPLVVAVAGKYCSAKHPLEELICYGNLGLCECIDRFDITRGYRFTTFAVYQIRGAITNSIQNHRDTISLDAASEDGATLLDIVPSEEIPLVPNAEHINQQVNKALESLTPDEADIIAMFFGLNYYEQTSGIEIASLLDIKYYHYQQFKKAALKKLKRLVLLKELYNLF